jgi:hypothetical protein
MPRAVLTVFLFLAILLAFTANPVEAVTKRVTVTAISANQTLDGYIVKTNHGRFKLAYGAGGYGHWDRIYSTLLYSLNNRAPVIIIVGPGGIEDARPVQ